MQILMENRKNTHKIKEKCLIFFKFQDMENNSRLPGYMSFFKANPEKFWHLVALSMG